LVRDQAEARAWTGKKGREIGEKERIYAKKAWKKGEQKGPISVSLREVTSNYG
jgi:hypothetical protein